MKKMKKNEIYLSCLGWKWTKNGLCGICERCKFSTVSLHCSASLDSCPPIWTSKASKWIVLTWENACCNATNVKTYKVRVKRAVDAVLRDDFVQILNGNSTMAPETANAGEDINAVEEKKEKKENKELWLHSLSKIEVLEY